MALVRVTVAGTIGKAVRINPDATKGSQIGVDLQLPDGTVPSLAELADALYTQSPPAQFIDDVSNNPTLNQIYESDIIDGLLLARVADDEVITGAYRYDTNLTMGNAVPINWRDTGSTKREFINFREVSAAATAVGHIISKLTAGVSQTSGTYGDVTGAKVAYASMEPNTDYAVFVRAYVGNSTSTTTALNGVQLTKGGTQVAGSEQLYESPSTTIDNIGMLYCWGGIVASGASGDLQLQQKSGNGADTVFANNVTIIMIKVDDLVLSTNIFHDTNTSTVALDDGTWKNTGAAITIVGGVSDWLVFGSVSVDILGNSTPEIRINDGTLQQAGALVNKADASDELTLGFMQLWQGVASATTLTVEAKTFAADKVYASIIAIRLDAFEDYNATFTAASGNLGAGPTDIATVAFTTTGAADYGFLSGATGPHAGTQGAPNYIRNNLNSGGDVTIAGSETQLGSAEVIAGELNIHWGVSADQSLGAGDTVDADLHAPDGSTAEEWFNCFLVAFQWNLIGDKEFFDVGNVDYITRMKGLTTRFYNPGLADYVEFDHDGADFNIVGFQTADINITGITSIQAGTVDADFDAITATSYGGVLEANLLDKTAIETVSAEWTFTDSIHLEHTASEPDDHALEIDTDAAGFGDVKAIDIDYITGAIADGQDEAVILINIDEVAATGGDVAALEILATEGSANVFGMLAGALVAPIKQLSGVFVNATLVDDDGVEETTALSSGGAGNISIFAADDDFVIVGSTAKFEEIEFILSTGASGAGIKPTFEFSDGVGSWVAFTPVDGTNAMRNTGVLEWLDSDIPTWAFGNASNEYLIRVTRTRNTLVTKPVADLVRIAATTEFGWDASGDLTVNDIVAASYEGIAGTNILSQLTVITGQTALTTGLASTDELLVSDAGTTKRMDVSVIEAYMQANLSFTSEINDLTAAVTWANVPDANITEGSVTQHQAAMLQAAAVAADFDALTATSYGGITEANLLDKSATETIAGAYSFENSLLVIGASGKNSDTVIKSLTSTAGHKNKFFQTEGASDLFGVSHVYDGVTNIYEHRRHDNSGAGVVVWSHPRTSSAVTFTGAISAVSYGGITEANLLDKTAVETISAEWDFTTNPKIDAAGIDTGIFAAARVATHTGEITGQTALTLAVAAITGKTALTSGLASTDELLLSDGGVIKRMDVSVIEAYMQANIDHDALTNFATGEHFTQGAISIPASQISDFDTEVSNNASVSANTSKVTNATHTSHVTGATALTLVVASITGQTALTSGLADTDEFLISDGGVIKRMDASVLKTYVGAAEVNDLSAAVTWVNVPDANITEGSVTQHQAAMLQAAAVDADFDAITGTSYGGITEANLLDKSAAETINAAWIIDGGTASPTLHLKQTNAGPWAIYLERVDVGSIIEVFNNNEEWWFRPALHVSGALTATSYGGITEANLLDKSATETVSGAYTFSADTTFGFVQALYFKCQVTTTTALDNIANAINTNAGKREGSMVWNTTTNKPVWANGAADNSVWFDATGATAHTPA